MSSRPPKRENQSILDLVSVQDEGTGKKYRKGKFLGKGGFAHCYELIDEAGTVYAGKIVPKSLLTKPHQKQKMAMEIEVHKALSHPHVVGFSGFFEDKEHVYILLELCRRRSLMELHKRRRALTEPEVRYFISQILDAVLYLHREKVIHRDLKLGNLFLNDNLEIKVGDFGLATKVEEEGERKRTLCGTPNYIAPEVLGKKGHSYEVDIWSLGCILYTLLVGRPPFETESLKDTYQRIKRNEYRIPSHISSNARALITRLLRADPSHRPAPSDIQQDPFLTEGFTPHRLPLSCLTTAPHFKKESARLPLSQVNPSGSAIKCQADKPTAPPAGENPGDWHLHSLLAQLSSCIDSNPASLPKANHDEAEHPASMPVFWVSKWVDYSDKYGLGYQLCDTSVGVLFNDSTRLLLGADGESVQYINRDLSEEFYGLTAFPDALYKKVTLLKYFRSYMSEHLLKAGGKAGERELDEGVRLPHLRAWFRTRSAIVLHLSNGIMQINFFQDHTKVVICPLMSAISFIDENKAFHTFRLPLIEQFGCSKELFARMKYAKTMAERLVTKLESMGGAGKSAAMATTPSDAPVPSSA